MHIQVHNTRLAIGTGTRLSPSISRSVAATATGAAIATATPIRSSTTRSNRIGYAIRAHVASKPGLGLNKIPQVTQVNTGWAIRAVDKTTRVLLLELQAE
ncbi:hypothetical protein H634G_11444 [Metarhizium anisopliae BRIP 53293]|uniref:Uncharacterized protein n=1 Tax=Metarhizium anisopliae BRIP 53293 TaxID=1291518 RepID=A0A0D9NHF9_METAN|nr:hypothetical protein H634G_11444 [Metarhizium anisopliae BRIP 53293]